MKKILIFCVSLTLLMGAYRFFKRVSPTDYTNYRVVYIPPNIHFSELSELFKAEGLINSPLLFKLSANYLEYDRKIKSGEFKLPLDISEFQLVNYLLKTKGVLRKVTFIEGSRLRDYASVVQSKLGVDSLQFVIQARNFLDSTSNSEGYFLPETYFFEYRSPIRDILFSLKNKTQEILTFHQSDIVRIGLTSHEILTLASIIQGECIHEDEMQKVSSVYHNRLKLQMKLEADPSIQYLLDKPRQLLLSDLKIKSPYNTYLYKGLPPNPINNPGKAAILAAIYPAKSKYLFFVADGSGYHRFAENYNQHLKNKKILDQLRHNLKRENK